MNLAKTVQMRLREAVGGVTMTPPSTAGRQKRSTVIQDPVVKELHKEQHRAAPPLPDRVEMPPVTQLRGTVQAPPSKSYSHRALMVAGLCDTPVIIENALMASDIIATAGAWEKLGATISRPGNGQFEITGVRCPRPASEIFVAESGTTLRFLLPGLAFAHGKVVVKGKGSLRARPNRMIADPLLSLGVNVESADSEFRIPLTITGRGELPAGDVVLSGGKSSQVVSSFLLWMPLASPRGRSRGGRRKASTIRVEGPQVSRPYVDVTRDMLNWAGIEVAQHEDAGATVYTVPAGQRYAASNSRYRVGGDYSSAAFLLAAAAITDSDVCVAGLRKDCQGDRRIVDILRNMGANIQEGEGHVRVVGPSTLRGVDLDCSDIPDLVPILCVLGTYAEGRTSLTNIAHLRLKESDRLEAPTAELRKLGARIQHTEDAIHIEKSSLHAAEVNSCGDHRIAMSMMVASLGIKSGGVRVNGVQSISKSYPRFLDDLRALGVPFDH